MDRREYLAAIAVVMGVSGCATTNDEPTMTQDEAKATFSDVTTFDTFGLEDVVEDAMRFTDDEYGIVFYAFRHQAAMSGSASQLEVQGFQKEEKGL